MEEEVSDCKHQPPRVSVALLAYNQASMVRRAAQSCLAQTGAPLEIVLSDDASTDDTFAVLQEVAAAYRGPHRVIARRNERNVGIGEHYNILMKACSGELIVTAAGDDFSLPERVQSLVSAWEATGRKADLVASHVVDLDHDGNLHDVIRVDDLAPYRGVDDWARKRPYIIGAGHAFTRRMMERFGPLLPGVFYEDQIMVFRAIVSGGAVTVDAPLVHYRRGGTSRRPVFKSHEHMQRWTDTQRSREMAEREQLIMDAVVAQCDDKVRLLLEEPLMRERYLKALRVATNRQARWQTLVDAPQLPLWWRFRKLLHVTFPHATVSVKRGLEAWHRLRR